MAIIAVVSIHVDNTALSFPLGSFNYDFGLAFRQIVNFPVAFFIFFSGLFVGRPEKGTAGSVWPSVKRLMIPYLAWAGIYIVCRGAISGIDLRSTIIGLFNGSVVGVGYFVLVMVQLVCITPFLKNMSDKNIILSIPLSLIFVVGYQYTVGQFAVLTKLQQFPYSGLPFFIWLPFYLLGIYAARGCGAWIRKAPILPLLVSTLICIGAAFLEAFWLRYGQTAAASQIKLTSMLSAACICTLALACHRLSEDRGARWLAWVGRRSFYFYLSHILILSLVEKVLYQIKNIRDIQVIGLPLVAVVTILVCAIGALTIERLVGNRPIVLRTLGLR